MQNQDEFPPADFSTPQDIPPSKEANSTNNRSVPPQPPFDRQAYLERIQRAIVLGAENALKRANARRRGQVYKRRRRR